MACVTHYLLVASVLEAQIRLFSQAILPGGDLKRRTKD